MSSGYDKRSRVKNWKPFSTVRHSTGAIVAGSVATCKEEVISYRDDVIEANRVSEDDFDPYLAGYHRSPGGIADHFDPGRRFLKSMEDAGLLTEKDRSLGFSRGIIPDNGHPFMKVTHRVETSPAHVRYRVHNLPTSGRASGRMPSVSSISTTSGAASDVLFPAQGRVAGREVFNFREGFSFPNTDDDLVDFGTLAISQCAPAVPKVSTAAILGELVQSIPAFPGHALLKSMRGSTIGDEYLNVVFGLVPTHEDAKNLAKVLRTLTARLHQLRRDAGRPVRRDFGVPTYQKAEILSSDSGQILLGDFLHVGCGDGYGFETRFDSGASSTQQLLSRAYYANAALYMRETRRTWFKGSFTYVLPELPGFSQRLESYMVEMDRLLGLTLNPSVAWQLSPWSWLIDWFIDIGDQMDILTVNFDDNLVLNYGYAMRETEKSIVAQVAYNQPEDQNLMSLGGLHTSLTSSVKRRIRANPYGFVLQTDGEFWSPYRLAVLGALGLTRL